MDENINKPKLTDAQRKELIDSMNSETEEYIQKMYSKNKDYMYEDGFTHENIDEILATHPAFMSKQPTQEEIDRSPLLQGLQSLQYDDPDDTPLERANAYKKDGNFQFKCKNYRKACLAYTEALRCKFDDVEFRTVLYSNRAASNFHLQNYRLSLLDANQAVKLSPNRIKSLLRCAQCCEMLKRFSDAVKWCEVLLSLDEKHELAKEIMMNAKKGLQLEARDKRKRQKEREKKVASAAVLVKAIKSRGITLEKIADNSSDDSDCEDSEECLVELRNLEAHGFSSNVRVHLDVTQNNLIWPVLFVYPEYGTTDFIEQFHEDTTFYNHLSVMFEQKPEWDVNHKYKPELLQIFYENIQTKTLHEVHVNASLATALSNENYVVQRGCPNFFIMSCASEYTKSFLSKYKLGF